VDHGDTTAYEADYIRHFHPSITYLKGDSSMWWTAATNFGIEYIFRNLPIDGKSDFILTLNNDLVVGKDYLKNLIKVYDLYQPCIVGTTSLYHNNHSQIDFAGCHWNKLTSRIKDRFDKSRFSYDDIRFKGIIESDLLPGRGMFIPLKVFESIGMFDDIAFPHYLSDYDFSIRASRAGFRLLVSTEAVVYNFVKQSGIRFDKDCERRPSFAFFYLTQMSIRSPLSLQNRFNWAKKHVKFSLLYFFVDSVRVLGSFIKYSVKYYLR
jgi:GT2 family glycosyltransferase